VFDGWTAEASERVPEVLGPDRGCFDAFGCMGFEALEILIEQAREFLGGDVVFGFVGPGVARVEHFARDVGHALGDHQAEERLAGEFVRDATFDRGVDHRARVRDLHARTDAVRAARPAGVDQPADDVEFVDLLAEQARVDRRMMHHERAPKQVENVACGSVTPRSVPATLAV